MSKSEHEKRNVFGGTYFTWMRVSKRRSAATWWRHCQRSGRTWESGIPMTWSWTSPYRTAAARISAHCSKVGSAPGVTGSEAPVPGSSKKISRPSDVIASTTLDWTEAPEIPRRT